MARPMSVAKTASSNVMGSADRVMSSTDWPVSRSIAQVAREHAPEPRQELEMERLVHAVVGAQRRELPLRHVARLDAQGRGDLVPGQDAERDEHEDRDPEQGEPDLRQSTADAARRTDGHGLPARNGSRLATRCEPALLERRLAQVLERVVGHRDEPAHVRGRGRVGVAGEQPDPDRVVLEVLGDLRRRSPCGPPGRWSPCPARTVRRARATRSRRPCSGCRCW